MSTTEYWVTARAAILDYQCPECDREFKPPSRLAAPKLVRCKCGHSFHPQMGV
jgi:DNA-directed RNA polymerase subunit RPC12/RpoP